MEILSLHNISFFCQGGIKAEINYGRGDQHYPITFVISREDDSECHYSPTPTITLFMTEEILRNFIASINKEVKIDEITDTMQKLSEVDNGSGVREPLRGDTPESNEPPVDL